MLPESATDLQVLVSAFTHVQLDLYQVLQWQIQEFETAGRSRTSLFGTCEIAEVL